MELPANSYLVLTLLGLILCISNIFNITYLTRDIALMHNGPFDAIPAYRKQGWSQLKASFWLTVALCSLLLWLVEFAWYYYMVTGIVAMVISEAILLFIFSRYEQHLIKKRQGQLTRLEKQPPNRNH